MALVGVSKTLIRPHWLVEYRKDDQLILFSTYAFAYDGSIENSLQSDKILFLDQAIATTVGVSIFTNRPRHQSCPTFCVNQSQLSISRNSRRSLAATKSRARWTQILMLLYNLQIIKRLEHNYCLIHRIFHTRYWENTRQESGHITIFGHKAIAGHHFTLRGF